MEVAELPPEIEVPPLEGRRFVLAAGFGPLVPLVQPQIESFVTVLRGIARGNLLAAGITVGPMFLLPTSIQIRHLVRPA